MKAPMNFVAQRKNMKCLVSKFTRIYGGENLESGIVKRSKKWKRNENRVFFLIQPLVFILPIATEKH